MSKKLITVIALTFTLAAAVAPSALPAAAAPASPGACNMLHTSSQGMAGMMKAAQGLENMMQLVIASEESGCSP
jgi:hypothetical protein